MRYPRVAVKYCLFASFRHLYLSRNDQAFLNAIGYDHATYALLVRRFQTYYDYYTLNEETGLIHRKKIRRDGTPDGRDRDMCAVGSLGLVLIWYRTRGSCTRGFAMIFGETYNPMYSGFTKYKEKCTYRPFRN